MSTANALALSDEEFGKLPVPTAAEPEVTEPTEEVPVEASTEAVEPVSEEEVTPDIPEEAEPVQEAKNEVPIEETTETTEEVTPAEVDYKKVYEEVFKPFKANGKDMAVDSVEDVRQLMQMGANYNKKMAALKPNLKLIKMLENNGLLDEEKISYLIDLNKHNPDAVKKLIKESGLDPLEVDINQEVSYKANTYNVNDKELELDAVLSEIKETESFNTTIDIIGNKWDDGSKRVLLDNPNVIKIINSHVQSGVYQTITNEVEKLRVLGKLEGLNDIDAYKAVGDALYAPRVNAPLGNNINTSTSKATNQQDPRIVEKRKAASTPKNLGVVSNAKPEFNPLSMSDEEFEKIASSKYI
jgi:hypothetical protein